MAVPKVFTQPKIYKAHCENCEGHLEFPSNMLGDTIVCPHCFQRTVLQPYGETRVEQLRHKSELSTFKESASAIQRAQNMDELVASRLEAVTQKPVGLTEAHAARKRSAEIEQVISMLRKPHTARTAFVASSILGIPKALES